MTFRRFYAKCLLVSILLTAAFVLFNVWMDDFGLFRSVKGRRIRVYGVEKTTKYLLSYRYVPENFDALLVGPSLSDQLDTRKIEGYRTYNLSILMGNVNELKPSVENVLNRGKIRLLIICLNPYLTRDAVLRDKRLRPESRFSALGSTLTFKLYNDKIKTMLKPEDDSFSDSWWGYSRPIQKGMTAQSAIDLFITQLARGDRKTLPVDPTSFRQLAELVRLARAKGARILAYYHPEPYRVHAVHAAAFTDYQKKMGELFTADDLVWDFNASQYDAFRKDYANYIDHGHLSVIGADFVVAELNRLLKEKWGR